jgi:hypothetical protein
VLFAKRHSWAKSGPPCGMAEERLSELIRARPAGVSPAAAIRDFILQSISAIRDMPPELARGTLGYLAAISPTVHRLALELADRQATALSTAIAATSTVAPEIARLQGIALAGVFRVIISESGRRTVDGQTPAELAAGLLPEAESILNELDRWMTLPPIPAVGDAPG